MSLLEKFRNISRYWKSQTQFNSLYTGWLNTTFSFPVVVLNYKFVSLSYVANVKQKIFL